MLDKSQGHNVTVKIRINDLTERFENIFFGNHINLFVWIPAGVYPRKIPACLLCKVSSRLNTNFAFILFIEKIHRNRTSCYAWHPKLDPLDDVRLKFLSLFLPSILKSIWQAPRRLKKGCSDDEFWINERHKVFDLLKPCKLFVLIYAQPQR